ncbi:High mobility group 20A [Micractinium conductrix]|uniref:High mobility group 20A n=1 Tax=Micractinium conductrix TaxID=554055 RepID=A0A2P6V9J7_9CHLO|nr:High mobility group 20A [Micractinium conductrix]|eukprot:PSC70760.1 High mobility group 20A [Micractinium conductrix]
MIGDSRGRTWGHSKAFEHLMDAVTVKDQWLKGEGAAALAAAPPPAPRPKRAPDPKTQAFLVFLNDSDNNARWDAARIASNRRDRSQHAAVEWHNLSAEGKKPYTDKAVEKARQSSAPADSSLTTGGDLSGDSGSATAGSAFSSNRRRACSLQHAGSTRWRARRHAAACSAANIWAAATARHEMLEEVKHLWLTCLHAAAGVPFVPPPLPLPLPQGDASHMPSQTFPGGAGDSFGSLALASSAAAGVPFVPLPLPLPLPQGAASHMPSQTFPGGAGDSFGSVVLASSAAAGVPFVPPPLPLPLPQGAAGQAPF